MAMFDRLHPKMRGIGEIELVQPSIQIYMQVRQNSFPEILDSDKYEMSKTSDAGNA